MDSLHSEKNARERDKRQRYIKSGLCPVCGKKNDRKGYYCSSCLKKTNASHKASRLKRIEKGLCGRCGKPMDKDGKRCKNCLKNDSEEKKASRRYYISMGVCPVCKTEILFGDEKTCIMCRAKRYKSLDDEKKKEANEYHKRWEKQKRKEREESGLCVYCGKHKPENGKKGCRNCLNRRMLVQRKRRGESYKIAEKRERVNNGFCWFCGKPVKEGYRTCEEHYKMCVENVTGENASRTREKMKKEGILY